MLHILFMLLKIAGFFLLIVVGLILFLLLSLLFVPVRYRLKGEKHSDRMQAEGTATWLFGLVSIRVSANQDGYRFCPRLFCISWERWKAFGKRAGSTWRRLKRSVSSRRKKTQSVTSVRPETVPGKRAYTDKAFENTAPTESCSNGGASLQKHHRALLQRLKRIADRLLEIPGRVAGIIQKIRLTIRGICAKIRRWRSFLKEESTIESISQLKDAVMALFVHIRPRVVKGRVYFGFDDPSLTGQVLGLCSMITPLYRTKLQVIPDFEEQILEGEIMIKGRLFGVVLLRLGLRIYRSRSIRSTLSAFRQKEA